MVPAKYTNNEVFNILANFELELIITQIKKQRI